MPYEYFYSFKDELEKLGFSPRASSILSGLGTGGGLGALAGATAGAAYGAKGGYDEARAQGAGVGRSALMGGLQGAGTGLTGMGIGASMGALGGAAAGGLRPDQMESLRKGVTSMDGPVGAFARFGQRQVHGITGLHPGKNIREGMEELRHGAHDPLKNLRDLKASGKAKPEELIEAKKRVKASLEAERMGLTNIPGYAKSLLKDPKATIRAALNEQWHGTDKATKAMMMGLPGVGIGQVAISKGDPNDEHPNRTRAKNVAKATANLGAGVLMGPMPQGTQMAIQMAGHHIGAPLGSNKAKPPKASPGIVVPPEQERGFGPPMERVESNAMRGLPPEGSQ